jgi:hypothetical protein
MKGARVVSRPAASDEGALYKIRVLGILGESWSEWLDGVAIQPQACGQTLLIGSIRDQAALHGLLNKIRDMGLPLLCIKSRRFPARVERKAATE